MQFSISKKIVNITAVSVIASSIVAFSLSLVFFDQLFEKNAQHEIRAIQGIVAKLHEHDEQRVLQAAKMLTAMPQLVAALRANDAAHVKTIALQIKTQFNMDAVTIADSRGIVLARGHSDRRGDDISNRSTMQTAMAGVTKVGILFDPTAVVLYTIRCEAPIYADHTLIGFLSLGFNLGTASHIDSLKQLIGRECTLFSGDTRVMTTLLNQNGKRAIGTKLQNTEILDSVLKQGKTVYSKLKLFNVPYSAAYWPVRDIDGKIIGMWFIGEPLTEQIEERQRAALITIACVAGVTLILALLTSVLGGRIALPIRKATDYAVQVADGKLDTPLSVQSHDEVGLLVDALKRMVGTLKERINEAETLSAKFSAMAHWYQSILDAMPFPVSVQNTEMQWTFINAALEKLLGKKRENVLGLHCSNWSVSICNTNNCAIACARRGLKQTHFSYGDVSYQVDVAILKDLQGETAGFLEVIQDITALEQMAKQQAEAETANQAKSSFLATMSHEIRTPMNAILGITEIQLLETTLSPNTRDALGKIYAAGYTLLGIINDLLDLSKIESGKMELMPVKYELASLIHDAVQLNMVRIGGKAIAFNLQVDENAPLKLFGDELRIKQILNNLLSNAFKYTSSGEVTLSVSVEYAKAEDLRVTLVCRVSDTGHGMTAEQVERLFDEYSRFNMETNRMIEGTGLGMNITQHLVHMMHGKISVESEPGKGSTFTVRLPQGRILDVGSVGRELADSLRQFKAEMPYMKTTQIVRDPMPYGSVLVVDDLETNLYVSRGLMAPYGLSIDTALSGFEAIGKIQDGQEYDIIFMDHMMPKMDGVEATRILRELGYDRPIVALTANAVAGQAEMFLNHGFDDFISKPLDLRQLNALLNVLIRDKQPPEVLETARRQQSGQDVCDGTLPPSVDPQLGSIFARDAHKAMITLEAMSANQFRRDDDVRMFVLTVHAMKSALANIGEVEPAAFAQKLEQAGREKDTACLAAETPAFLTVLRGVIAKVAPKELDEDSETSDEDPAYLHEQLRVIQAACAAWDKKAAKDALTALRRKTWSRQTREQLDVIAEYLLHSDFEEAAEAAGVRMP